MSIRFTSNLIGIIKIGLINFDIRKHVKTEMKDTGPILKRTANYHIRERFGI